MESENARNWLFWVGETHSEDGKKGTFINVKTNAWMQHNLLTTLLVSKTTTKKSYESRIWAKLCADAANDDSSNYFQLCPVLLMKFD